jgi:hypothetical protein
LTTASAQQLVFKEDFTDPTSVLKERWPAVPHERREGDIFDYLQSFGSTPDIKSYRPLDFHFSAGEAKEWLENLNGTLPKNKLYQFIQENNGLYAFKGRGNYFAATALPSEQF